MVDVIIPAYLPNEKYLYILNRALKSLENQTFKHFEVHLVLNGLYDLKENILPNIKYNGNMTIHDMNGKASGAKARNYGIKNTKRRYIAYIDVDDQYLPEKLEKQVEFLETESYIDVLGTRTYYLINERLYNPKFAENEHESHEQIYAIIEQDNVMFHGSLMFRREIFEKYNFYYNEDEKPDTIWKSYGRKMWEDWDLWLRMIKGGIKFHNLRDPLYIWTIGTSVER